MKENRILRVIFSVDLFKLVFFFVSLLGVCPWTSGAITPFLKLFHIYGFLVLLIDLLTEKRILRNKGRLILVLFVLSYGITLLSNRELINFSDLSNFCYLLLVLGLVYSYGEKDSQIILIGCNVLCIAIMLMNLIGIMMFYAKYSVFIPEVGYIGCFPYENRLAGLFGNPNVLGMVCLIGISLSAFLWIFRDGFRYRWIYVISLVIDMVTLLLSNSRTQIYSVIFGCMVLVALQIWKYRKGSRGVVFSIFASLFVGIIVFFGFQFVQKGLASLDVRYDYYVQHISSASVSDVTEPSIAEPTTEPSTTEPSTIESSDNHAGGVIAREERGLNGRLELWETGFELFKLEPLFGIGLDNHDNVLVEHGYEPLPVKGNLHNVYLDTLVCCGLAGFSCLLGYLILMLRNLLYFFLYGSGKNWTKGSVLTAVIMAFLLDGFADSTLIASFYPTAIAFWFFASQLAQLIEEENKQSGHYRPSLMCRLADKLSCP